MTALTCVAFDLIRDNEPVARVTRLEFGAEVFRAVNSHEALVAACEAALEHLESDKPRLIPTLDKLRAALAKAKGE